MSKIYLDDKINELWDYANSGAMHQPHAKENFTLKVMGLLSEIANISEMETIEKFKAILEAESKLAKETLKE
jgi:hypothetical protein